MAGLLPRHAIGQAHCLGVLLRLPPHLRCAVVERGLVVRVVQQILDGEKDRAGRVDGRPLLLKNIEADNAMHVHVWVETRGQEGHPRGLVGVLRGKDHGELVLQALVRGVGDTLDRADPVKEIVIVGKGRDALGTAHHELHQLALEAGRGAAFAVAIAAAVVGRCGR